PSLHPPVCRFSFLENTATPELDTLSLHDALPILGEWTKPDGMRPMSDSARIGSRVSDVFTKETLVEGAPAKLQCVEIAGQVFSLSSGFLRVAQLEDEWYEDLRDPAVVIDALASRRSLGADLFTFWQRLPHAEPAYE